MKPFYTMLRALGVFLLITSPAMAQQRDQANADPAVTYNYTSFSQGKDFDRQAWTQLNPNQASHQELGKLYAYAPDQNCVEVIDRRSVDGKYYVNPKRRSEIFIQRSHVPLHFKKDGQWVTIDERLRPLAAGIYEASNQSEPVGFDTRMHRAYIRTMTGTAYFNDWTLSGKTGSGETRFLAKADWSHLTAGDNGVYIKDIFPGMDAEMRVARGMIKTNFIIRRLAFSGYEQLLFADRFAAEAGATALAFEESTGASEQVGTALFRSGATELLKVVRGVVFPEGLPGEHRELLYALNGDQLTVRVPVDYIAANIGTRAIIVDPLVTSALSTDKSLIGSMYNASCSWANSCDYTMSVPIPAGTTITDVIRTTSLLAMTPCGVESGGLRITSGACGWPAGGTFRICTGTGPGACGGTTTILPEMSSCLPAPSCDADTVDFTLRMYRGCVGPTGCDMTCFTANGPWTITVQARTVEYTGDSLTYNTNDSVCKGTAVTFGGTPRYGVGPYSLPRWSWNKSGTPSLDSSATFMATFANAGSYKIYASALDACGNIALDSQVVYVDSPANPVVTSPVIYCQRATATALTATGTNLKWYATAISTPDLGAAPTPSTVTVAADSFYVSQSSYLGCEGERAKIRVQVNPTPSAPLATTTYNYCEGATATALTATPSSASDTLKWYTDPSTGTALAGAPTPATTAVGSTTWYVGQKNAFGCESDTRTAITVNIRPVPAAPTVVSPVNYCKGATATALTATAASASDTLIWYDATMMSLSAAPLPVTTTTGTFTWYVSQRSMYNCESPVDTIDVQVNPLPAAPAATIAYEYCKDATATALTATAATAADTLKWYDAGGTLLAGAPTPATGTAGTFTWTVGQRNSFGCDGPRTTITVVVRPQPAAPTGTTSYSYCQNATATTLTATASSATDTLKWYDASSAPLSAAPTPVTTTAGTFTWYVSQKSQYGCESPKAAIAVQVNPLPVAPAATATYTYCQNATATTLTATATSASDTLKWYDASGTLLPGAPTPVTTAAGTFTWKVSQKTSFGCEGPQTTITVTVNPQPAAPAATTAYQYCQGATATTLTATASSASDTLKWYDGSHAPLSAAPTPVTTTAGAFTWYVSQKSALGCESAQTTITVTVRPEPVMPAATTTYIYCQNAAATSLTATATSASDTLKWYDASSTLLSAAPTPVTTATGTFTWYVSQKSQYGCEGPKRTITVTVNPTPLAPAATTAYDYCLGATAAALTATATTANDTLKWYDAANAPLSAAPTPSTAAVGAFTWTVSQKNNFGCESPKTTITVNVQPIPAAPAATTTYVYCQNATATALTATAGSASDTLKWYDAANAPLSAAPTPSTATTGTFTWKVSQKSKYGCEGAKTTITVTINPTPAAPVATTPYTYCQGKTATTLTATAATVNDTLRWYDASGTLLSGAPTPSTATVGTFTWTVNQKNNFGCESPKTTITVTINATPAAPVVSSPLHLCIDGPSGPLTATGSNLKWYSAATGGTGSTTAPTPGTTALGSTFYYVSQSTALGCEGPRAELEAIVNPRPAAPTVTSPIELCVGVAALPLTAAGINLKWYTVPTGGTGSSTAIVPPTAVTGSTDYYVSQTSVVGCEGARATITANVHPSPLLSLAPLHAPAFAYCPGETVTIKANAPTATSYQWYRDAVILPGEIVDTIAAGVNGYYAMLVTDMYGCQRRDSVLVFKDTLPVPKLSPTDVQICPGVNVVLYVNPNTAGYTFQWFKDAGWMSLPLTTDHTPVNLSGSYHVIVTDIYECITTTNTATVTTYPAITKPTILRTDPVLRVSGTYNSYQWYRNGKPITGATGNSYTMSFDGEYYVEVSDVFGCLSQSDPIEVTKLSVGQYAAGSIRVFPSPTQGVVQIESPLKVNVIVTNVTGQTVWKGEEVKQVDISNLADGLYLFHITDDQGSKLLVEKINKTSQQ